MSKLNRAVFLSYASQDAEAARRICGTLRNAGIEVWLDQSELRGGDAWDRQIRKQIRDCTLFIPIISARSQSRLEGYFRREWKLAVERTYDMAEEKAFLLPVTIDETSERTASVPDKFRDVQWTQLPAGETPPDFIERVSRLLSQDTSNKQELPRTTAAAGLNNAPAAKAATPADWVRPGRSGSMVALLIVGIVVLVAAALAYRHSHQRTVATSKGTAAAAQPTAANALSIIVLPFANQTGDPQKGYIADALTTSITSDLGRIRDAYVVPAPTAFTYKDKPMTIQHVGEDAHVRFLLSGSVESTATHIRINAQLIDGSSGTQIWNKTFTGESTDLFALQDRVTTLVGNSLGREMVIAAARGIQGRSTDAQSADLLLRARALSTNSMSLENFQKIEALYRAMLKREPNNTTMLSGLAEVLVDAASNGLYAPKTRGVQKGMMAEAEALAKRARELEPDVRDKVEYVLGWTALYRGDFRAAERALRGALEKAPRDPESYNNLGALAYAEYEPKKALDFFKTAADLTPGPPPDYLLINTCIAYLELGDFNAAIDSIEKALEISPHTEPAFALAAVAYDLKGNRAAAEQWAQKAKAANVVPADAVGFPAGSESYQRWANAVLLPAWRKLGLPE
jgi:TolB-like protein/Flp pilus assembly protein TadD